MLVHKKVELEKTFHWQRNILRVIPIVAITPVNATTSTPLHPTPSYGNLATNLQHTVAREFVVVGDMRSVPIYCREKNNEPTRQPAGIFASNDRFESDVISDL